MIILVFLFARLLHQSCQESKHKCYKSFLATRLLGQIREDKVWHSSLLVRMWEAQCESLRCHSLAPCKLFAGPRMSLCSKNTISIGTVCYVIRAKTWCLVATWFDDVGKVGFSGCSIAFGSYKPFRQRFWKYKDVDRVWTQFQCGLDDPALVVLHTLWYHSPSLKKCS